MAINFEKIDQAFSRGAILDPKQIFTSLVRSNAKFKRPTDEQARILDKWFEKRVKKDNIIKMNTGAGKTLVGLLALQSSLNEKIFPAVYVAPDNYLVEQVRKEANELGIKTASDENSPEFISGDAIFITTAHKVFHGFSIFSDFRDHRRKIGAIVIDDVHSCMDSIQKQFSIIVDSSHELYQEVFKIFEKDLELQSYNKFCDIKDGVSSASLQVPFWAWNEKIKKVVTALMHHRGNEEIQYQYNLVIDDIKLFDCYFSGKYMEISSKCLPIDVITSFDQAKRRIYMTATLTDDSALSLAFNAMQEDIKDLICLDDGEIGERMILIPEEINPKITSDDIKKIAKKISEKYNVVVIVPSGNRASYWEDISTQTLTATNLKKGVNKLHSSNTGISVFVGKYDGIDLPGDACRLLIIDGLPEVYSLSERNDMLLLKDTEAQLSRQIQRIEQGMGRGVRSSEDYCAVILLGKRLADRLHEPSAKQMFSSATQAQINLAEFIREDLEGKNAKAIYEAILLCLNRDSEWVRVAKKAIINQRLSVNTDISNNSFMIRKAFNDIRAQQYSDACNELQKLIAKTTDLHISGYYKQLLAKYTYNIDKDLSQQRQLSAYRDNNRITKPISGISFSKTQIKNHNQVTYSIEYYKNHSGTNDMILNSASIVESFIWGDGYTDSFEEAIYLLGSFLGYISERPELETGKGPDNAWIGEGPVVFVIECKTGSNSEEISKRDCGQLLNSINWAKERYVDPKIIPIMIHKSNTFQYEASPSKDFRIINEEKLSKLNENILQYASAFSSAQELITPKKVQQMLMKHNFAPTEFIVEYTAKFKHKTSC